MRQNRGYGYLREILAVSRGDEVVIPVDDPTVEDIALFRYAPTVSVDVERSFSRCKTLLSDNGLPLKNENVKHPLIPMCCNPGDSEDE